MPCRIPAARRREQSPAISVFVSCAPPLPAKPSVQAIKNALIDPSPSPEGFPADVVVLIEFNCDDAAPAGPNFDPPLNNPFVFRLLQTWSFIFEMSRDRGQRPQGGPRLRGQRPQGGQRLL